MRKYAFLLALLLLLAPCKSFASVEVEDAGARVQATTISIDGAHSYTFDGSTYALNLTDATATALNTTTPVMDLSKGNIFTITPTANATVTATNIKPGAFGLIVTTSGSTSYTLTFSTGIKTTSSTLATGATTGKIYGITYTSDGTRIIETARTGAL